MDIRIMDDAGAVAREAARFLVDEARAAIAARKRFSLALSGGSTPWRMLGHLDSGDLPWEAVELFQVDERVAPAGSEERNLTHLDASLVSRVPVPGGQVHAMPVEAPDLDAAIRSALEEGVSIPDELLEELDQAQYRCAAQALVGLPQEQREALVEHVAARLTEQETP